MITPDVKIKFIILTDDNVSFIIQRDEDMHVLI